MTEPTTLRRGGRGYSLIEVLIAMGLLSTVLLVIVTLFFMARSNVYSGKQTTHAVAVGTRIMEDLSSMSVPTVYANFNITDTTGLGTVTAQPSGMDQSSYSGSILRSTSSVATAGKCTGSPIIAFNNDPGGFMQRWYCQMLETNNEMPNPSIALVLTPRRQYPTADTLTAGNATVIRVRAIIRWKEGLRNRQLILDTTKTRRPL
jgi:prepilin-type N-terminal cleavage/methylation domain-containing protein